jgi:hypothetical protein
MIDVTFDVRDDAGNGDPDITSATLRRYHQLLWSRALPGGEVLSLDAPKSRSYYYLHHQSSLGEFRFGSDTVVPTFRSWKRKQMRELIDQIPVEELDEFQYWNHTIGGMMIFPKGAVGGHTMNGARGVTAEIADRFDLTVECIRLQYLGINNPLSGTMQAYWDFFALFGTFDGYIDFFLLQDIVDNAGAVRFFLPFEGFGIGTLPSTTAEYRLYRDGALVFLKARNVRIDEWSRTNL